jgi:hypothetical protein
MEVRDVPRGDAAPDGTDRITINTFGDGRFGFTGRCKLGDVTAHTVSPNMFDSEDPGAC